MFGHLGVPHGHSLGRHEVQPGRRHVDLTAPVGGSDIELPETQRHDFLRLRALRRRQRQLLEHAVDLVAFSLTPQQPRVHRLQHRLLYACYVLRIQNQVHPHGAALTDHVFRRPLDRIASLLRDEFPGLWNGH